MCSSTGNNLEQSSRLNFIRIYVKYVTSFENSKTLETMKILNIQCGYLEKWYFKRNVHHDATAAM